MQTARPPVALPRHRTVADVMTTPVVTAAPDSSFKDVVTLLTERRVSALPVVDATGALVGIVSEADLLAKERRLDEPRFGALRRSWRDEHSRADAIAVDALMTTPVITVTPNGTLQQAARLMHSHRVRRLCVVDDAGHLIGLVTRGDLLRGFVRSDEEIVREIRDGVMLRVMWIDPAGIRVDVNDGIVRLTGEVERRSDADILAAMARELDGVVGVETELTWRLDDRDLSLAMNARI